MEPKTLFRKGMGHRSEHFVHPSAASNLALGVPREANVVVAFPLRDRPDQRRCEPLRGTRRASLDQAAGGPAELAGTGDYRPSEVTRTGA